MKRRLPSFFAGMLTMFLICSLTVSALAISGRMTLEVEPINVMVNGEVFQPKDGLGRDVPVFVYRGTTYAPLRALAEAYGLEVGYDKAQNLATVTDPRAAQASTPVGIDMDYSDWSEEEEKAYQEFKAMWTVEDNGLYDRTDGEDGYAKFYTLYCIDEEMTSNQFRNICGNGSFILRLAHELWSEDHERDTYNKIHVVYKSDVATLYHYHSN